MDQNGTEGTRLRPHATNPPNCNPPSGQLFGSCEPEGYAKATQTRKKADANEGKLRVGYARLYGHFTGVQPTQSQFPSAKATPNAEQVL